MSLLNSLKAALTANQADSSSRSLNPEIAAAVLLVSVERADFEEADEERQVVEQLLAKHFGLQRGELEALLEEAEKEVGSSVSFYDYVQTLNDSLEYSQKCDVFTMLWQVAYADGRLDPFEEQLMRRLADMLYLSHADYVRTKLAVVEEAV